MSIVQADYIEFRESRAGEQIPFMKGTRVSVLDIYVCHELMGRTPDEIVIAYPHMTLAHIYAALSYSFDHLEEIRRQLKDDKKFADSLREKMGPGPLSDKLKPTDADDDSFSS
jgi:uncharacterized protein (DUF433 family)